MTGPAPGEETVAYLRGMGDDIVDVEWLDPAEVAELQMPWNAAVSFDDVLAGSCSDWIDDRTVWLRTVPGVVQAHRSDRELIYVAAEPDLDVALVEVELRLAWLEVVDGWGRDPRRGPGA